MPIFEQTGVGDRGWRTHLLMGLGIYSFYQLLQPRFRAERTQFFQDRFKPGNHTSILDVGGMVGDWRDIPIDSSITVLNIDPPDPSAKYSDRFTYTMGDGRRLPYPDQSFDIVYSNSVIEHLPTYEDQNYSR